MVYIVIVAGIVAVLISASAAAAKSYTSPAERDRLLRVERKLDLILAHLGLDDTPTARSAWQAIADEPGRKIEAIKAYRKETNAGLAESKWAVEAYMERADSGRP